MAYAIYLSGNLEQALETVEQAIELNPIDHYFNSKGEFLFRSGRRENAIEMYNKGLELNPNFFKENYSDLYKLLFPNGEQ